MKIRLLAGYILFFSTFTSLCYAENYEKNKNANNTQIEQTKKIFSDKDTDYFKNLQKQLKC